MYKLNINTDTINITQEDIDNIVNALANSDVTIFNSQVLKTFESLLSKFLSKDEEIKNITMPNCTSAIFVALQLISLQENDEVIVPNLTHASAILPAIHIHKCKIKVCEFQENSYDLNLNHLRSLITPKTKALIVSYLHGFPFNLNEIKEICEKYMIKIIEDSAQGLGVKIGDKLAGTIGDYGCFSFGANKLLRTGEGGSLIYKNQEDFDNINQYRHVGEVWKNFGLSTVSSNFTYRDILENGFDYLKSGFNFRFNPINIALGIRSLKNLDEIIKNRQEKLSLYQQTLKDILGIRLINDSIYKSAPISAWFLIDPNYYDINKLIVKCIELGIPVGKFKYPTITKTEVFKEYIINIDDNFTCSNYIQNNSIFLPLYENIAVQEIKAIGENIKEILMNFETIAFNANLLDENIKYFNGFFLK
jgi:dTDP-4-amino-4,6-dideoxygalactose transaminase